MWLSGRIRNVTHMSSKPIRYYMCPIGTHEDSHKTPKADKNENTKIFNLDTKKVTRRAIWINRYYVLPYILVFVCRLRVGRLFIRANVHVRGSYNIGHNVFLSLFCAGNVFDDILMIIFRRHIMENTAFLLHRETFAQCF